MKNFNLNDLIVIFIMTDDLSKDIVTEKKVGNKSKLSLSEITTMLIYGHKNGLKSSKQIYNFILNETNKKDLEAV